MHQRRSSASEVGQQGPELTTEEGTARHMSWLSLLLMLGQPLVTSGSSTPLDEVSAEERYWIDSGFSPEAIRILRADSKSAPDILGSEETLGLASLRESAEKGLVPADQYRTAEEAYFRKRDLRQARRDHQVLLRLRGVDRHLYLIDMRPRLPPPPSYPWRDARPQSEDRAKSGREFRKLLMQRAAREEAEWRHLSGSERLAFLIGIRSIAP